jgi:aspartyl-tRNA synthetase
LLFGEELNDQLDKNPLGREYVIQATGMVSERTNKNPNIPTGGIEIKVFTFSILNKSNTPPFTIQDDTDGGDDLRMKYRFLDLRRPQVRKNLELRYAINRSAREYLHQHQFIEVETPYLIKSTPEGARIFAIQDDPSQLCTPQIRPQTTVVSGYEGTSR